MGKISLIIIVAVLVICFTSFQVSKSRKIRRSKNYTIAWKSKITEKTGGGTTRFSFNDAMEICNKMDREYPDIKHLVLENIEDQNEKDNYCY